MEFIKENYFYLIGFILFILYIKRLATSKKRLEETKIEELKDLFKLFPIVIFIVEIFWIVAGVYNHEKLLFIALATTYICSLLYGLKEGINIDKADLVTNFESAVTNHSNKVIKSQETSKFITFLSFVQVVVTLAILINHYKIALFYLFYN